jgi:secondary thiamine-phosphate synthase enzyme
MRQAIKRITVRTRGAGLYEFTDELRRIVAAEKFREGLLTVFIRHTSASLMIQENADPDVLHDLDAFFCRVVPEDERLYRHTTEGPDDMPSHIRAALTLTQIAIPVSCGALTLGTWQGVYVFEHRAAPHTRDLVVHFVGE